MKAGREFNLVSKIERRSEKLARNLERREVSDQEISEMLNSITGAIKKVRHDASKQTLRDLLPFWGNILAQRLSSRNNEESARKAS